MSSIFADPVSWTTEHRAQAQDGKDRTILHAPIRATNGRVGAWSPSARGIGAGVRAFPTPEHPASARRMGARDPCASRSSALLSLMVVPGSACRLRLPYAVSSTPDAVAGAASAAARSRGFSVGNPRLGLRRNAVQRCAVAALREALHTRRDRRQIQYRCVFLMLGNHVSTAGETLNTSSRKGRQRSCAFAPLGQGCRCQHSRLSCGTALHLAKLAVR